MDSKSKLTIAKISKILKDNDLSTADLIIDFLDTNSTNFSYFDLSKIAENANGQRIQNSAYYTDEELLDLIYNDLPDFEKEKITILEPSVGVGNFLPYIFKKYNDKKVVIDVVDIDNDSLLILKKLLSLYNVPKNIKINYINADFCTLVLNKKYDLAIGNPPFSKVKKLYTSEFAKTDYFNFDSTNLASYFYEKCCKHCTYTCLVLPKNILNTPEFDKTRSFLNTKNVQTIFDFGEKGFKGVLIETIYIKTNNNGTSGQTKVYSYPRNKESVQKQSYIFDEKLPYWIIYRNSEFDKIFNNMRFNIFDVFRDRQITNKILKEIGSIKVIKSRNIKDDGTIASIKGYDSFIDKCDLEKLAIYSFLDRDDVYLTPNMTYYPRVIKKEKGYIVNGSVAILLPKDNIVLTKKQMDFFATNEYRTFYQIARNYQTRSLNIDSSSVYFFGIREDWIWVG